MIRVLSLPYMQTLLTKLRDRRTNFIEFRETVREIGKFLAYEIANNLDYKDIEVQTPLGIARGKILSDEVVLVIVLRAALPLVNGMMEVFKDAYLGVIAARRMENGGNHASLDFGVEISYLKLPKIDNRVVIVADPMLATGSTMVAILSRMKELGRPKRIILATIVAARPGVERVKRIHPDVDIYTLAVDEKLNDRGYIVPGLGDAGDRAFGTI